MMASFGVSPPGRGGPGCIRRGAACPDLRGTLPLPLTVAFPWSTAQVPAAVLLSSPDNRKVQATFPSGQRQSRGLLNSAAQPSWGQGPALSQFTHFTFAEGPLQARQAWCQC